MLTFRDAELSDRLGKETGHDASHIHFRAFSDVAKSVAIQIQRVRGIPFLPREVDVHGFVYDVRTGKLHELASAGAEKAATA